MRDIGCTVWAFLRWVLRRTTWICQRSSSAVLAPPSSPATASVGAGGESVPLSCRVSLWALKVLRLSAHRPRDHRGTTAGPHIPRWASQPRARARGREGSKPLGAIPCVTGRLQPPLAGARHVHRVTLAIGRRVGRARGSARDAASSAAAGPRSGPCARPGETLCGAPGGESVLLLVARPAGRPGPARQAGRGSGAAGRPEPPNPSSAWASRP